MIEEKTREFAELFAAIRGEIGKRVVGLDDVVDHAINALFLGGHVLLEGVPGLGKTLLVKTLAETLDLNFSRVQFTPDLMPADIVGTNIIVETAGQKAFSFQKGPVFTNILLADEINRATPKTQSALLESMQEKSVTVSGEMRNLEEPFCVLATENPIEMEGTYPLPEAQVDRFLYKVIVPFPEEKDLVTILNLTTTEAQPAIRTVATRDKIREFLHFIPQVPAADAVVGFAAQLILRTHPDHSEAPESVRKYVRYGSSPRGAQALILSAKIRALRDGRYHIAREDILSELLPCLRHRLILNIEGQAEDVSTDAILNQLVK
jgi:MoxR-like ATPase